jgi:PAS domain S-box-containing protein
VSGTPALEAQNDQLRTDNAALVTSNEALVGSRDRFRALYDFAPIPYVTIDAALAIVDVNRAAELMLDTSRDRLLDSRFDRFVVAGSRAGLAAFVASVFATGADRASDLVVTPDGAPPIDVQIDGVVVRDLPDCPLRCVLAIVDITIRKRAELARRQAQDEVLAIVSHDLRGPLNAIGLACDGLAAGLPADEHRECVRAIERAAHRCERLIRDLLGVAHIESGGLTLDLGPMDACALVRAACLELELEAIAAGCALTVTVPDQRLEIRADRDRLHQVLSNLLGNTFVHARGAAVEIRLIARGDDVDFTVSDTGPGIPAPELPRVFDRYRQGKGKHHHGGAGLGLAIVKGLVLAHHGTVAVHSEVGHGARFEVTVPVDGERGRSSAGAQGRG